MVTRFAVGTPDGPHSRIWKLWNSRAEVYLAIRTAGSLYKCSLHSALPGKAPVCQLSLTSEFKERLDPGLGLPGSNRHMNRWLRHGPDALGQTLGVRLYLPFSGLRTGAVPVGKSIQWLANPGPGQMAEIRFVFCPEQRAEAALRAWPSEWRQFVDSPLPNGERFAAFVAMRDTTPEQEAIFRADVARAKVAAPQWKSAEIDFASPSLGLLLHGPQADGMYTLVDMHL